MSEIVTLVNVALEATMARLEKVERENKEILAENKEIKDYLYQSLFAQREINERLRYWPYVRIQTEQTGEKGGSKE